MGDPRGAPVDRRSSGLKAQLELGMKQARTIAASVSRRKSKSWDGREGGSEGRGTPSEPSTPGPGFFDNTVVSPQTLAGESGKNQTLYSNNKGMHFTKHDLWAGVHHICINADHVCHKDTCHGLCLQA
jgi:hypothetical protein